MNRKRRGYHSYLCLSTQLMQLDDKLLLDNVQCRNRNNICSIINKLVSITMALPSTKKRKKNDFEQLCIICNCACEEDKSNLPDHAWITLRDQLEQWRGLDRFGTVYDNISWDDGPEGLYFHKLCKAQVANTRLVYYYLCLLYQHQQVTTYTYMQVYMNEHILRQVFYFPQKVTTPGSSEEGQTNGKSTIHQRSRRRAAMQCRREH